GRLPRPMRPEGPLLTRPNCPFLTGEDMPRLSHLVACSLLALAAGACAPGSQRPAPEQPPRKSPGTSAKNEEAPPPLLTVAVAARARVPAKTPETPTPKKEEVPAKKEVAAPSTSRKHRSMVPEINPKDFEKLITLIKPHEGESGWAKIPWLTSLAEAWEKA